MTTPTSAPSLSPPLPDESAHSACMAIITAAAAYRRLHLGDLDRTPYVRITDARAELFRRVDDLLLQLGGEEKLPQLRLTTESRR